MATRVAVLPAACTPPFVGVRQAPGQVSNKRSTPAVNLFSYSPLRRRNTHRDEAAGQAGILITR